MTERQILEHEILARAERVDDPADELATRCEHGQNLIAMLALQPSYKSFILDSHDILISLSHVALEMRQQDFLLTACWLLGHY